MTNAATPKQHMITDSHENKRARQQPEHSDMSESEDEGQGSNKKQAMEANTTHPTRTNTVNGVITLQNGLKITAPPMGGFPSPQLGQSVWRNVALTLRERWPQKAGPKAWVRMYRAKYEDNAQMTNIKMRNLIALTIGETAAAPLLLSTPSTEGDLYEHLPPPYHFLISGISQSAITRLTGLGVCSSPKITCFFVPYNQPLPNYICTLEHFTLPDCEESNMEITNLVKQTICMHPNISLFIHDHTSTPDAEAAIKVINSIRIMSLSVAVSRTISHTVWNVYADSLPNMSLKDYFEWTNLICNLQFTSEDYGTGLV